MKKYDAYQIAPENQDPELFYTRNGKLFYEDETWSDISLMPRRGFHSILSEPVEDACRDSEISGLYMDSSDYDSLCSLLTATTGDKYIWRTLRGCCQNDWRIAVYPEKYYTKSEIDSFEKLLFNTGTQWSIDYDDDDSTGTIGIYCVSDSDDDIRRELAEYLDTTPENVTMYKFSGYTRIPNYEKI